MYKVFKYLFGWDYVLWRTQNSTGISRVFTSYSGHVMYKQNIDLLVLEKPEQAIWLTCEPNKYFKELTK